MFACVVLPLARLQKGGSLLNSRVARIALSSALVLGLTPQVSWSTEEIKIDPTAVTPSQDIRASQLGSAQTPTTQAESAAAFDLATPPATAATPESAALPELATLEFAAAPDPAFRLSAEEESTPLNTGLNIKTLSSAAAPAYSEELHAWVFENGAYEISGTAKELEHIVVRGDVALTFMGVSIDTSAASIFEDLSSAVSIEAGSLVLTLEGNNSLVSSLGKAGVMVASEASLTVQGSGSLSTQGGSAGTVANASGSNRIVAGGAGIGGNGIIHTGNTSWSDNTTAAFGSIAIKGGILHAMGGNARPTSNAGGGAGIGGGGYTSNLGVLASHPFQGAITISGGTITAEGGDCKDAITTAGGAGIGSGGSAGEAWSPVPNNVTTTITGGTITATGKMDAAGIGGGANTEGGIIAISGGTISAYAGKIGDRQICGLVGSAQGGAGIGGGDNGGFKSITITGGDIFAQSAGSGAGIGSGRTGAVAYYSPEDSFDLAHITIAGSAQVVAQGGSNSSLAYGGAGIGKGVSHTSDQPIVGVIELGGNASIKAYAGAHAQAIGKGSYGDMSEAANSGTLSITSEKVQVWMFTQTNDADIFWGLMSDGITIDPALYHKSKGSTVWYSPKAEEASNRAHSFPRETGVFEIMTQDHQPAPKTRVSNTFAAETALADTLTADTEAKHAFSDDEQEFVWTPLSNEIVVSHKEKAVARSSVENAYAPINWATFTYIAPESIPTPDTDPNPGHNPGMIPGDSSTKPSTEPTTELQTDPTDETETSDNSLPSSNVGDQEALDGINTQAESTHSASSDSTKDGVSQANDTKGTNLSPEAPAAEANEDGDVLPSSNGRHMPKTADSAIPFALVITAAISILVATVAAFLSRKRPNKNQ